MPIASQQTSTPIFLDQIGDTELQALFGNQPITAFLGSGVSIWDPTNLPNGKAFADGLFQALFPDNAMHSDPLGPLRSELQELFRKIPFEIVMEKCPEPDLLARSLKRIYNVTNHNAIHRVFADKFITGEVHSIVTTNYDCCIDQVLSDLLGHQIGPSTTPVRRVVNERDIPNGRAQDRVYFKIHGSADDVTGSSMVFRLTQESALPSWKRSLLREMLTGRLLLIVGYSGLDFEICPEISQLKPAQIIWNFLKTEDMATNARIVLGNTNGHALIGDMRDLVSRLLGSVVATMKAPSVDTEKVIRDTFTESDQLLWRARLLNSLSYGRAALKIVDRLLKEDAEPIRRIEILEERARALHYVGAYKQAAHQYEDSVVIARTESLSAEIVYSLLLSASDNWRCHGSFHRSRKRLSEAETLISSLKLSRSDLLASAMLKRILLLRRNYQLASLFRRKSAMLRIRTDAESLFKSATEALLVSGRWFEWQQLRLWADRFDLPEETTRPDNLYEPPPSREGYEHLGFPMAQMMVFRDEVDTGRRLADEETATEAVQKVGLAEKLGVQAEGWKLNYLLLKRFPSHRTRLTFTKFIRNFWACEYTLPMRMALLIIRP